MRSRPRSSPAAISAGAYGTCGGAIQATSRPCACNRASAGSTRRISPMPSRSSTISVSAPPGQPRPGSMASSAGKPDGSAAGSGAQSPPRQMAGFDSTAARAGFMRVRLPVRCHDAAFDPIPVTPSLLPRGARARPAGHPRRGWRGTSDSRTDRRRRRCDRRRTGPRPAGRASRRRRRPARPAHRHP